MKKIIILIPIYNDWKSLTKLIEEISENINIFSDFKFKCLVINDSSSINQPKLSKPRNFHSLKIMNMKQNKGHARCNAFGIRHVFEKEDFDYLILMDGDGEDRPVEIKNFIEKILKNPNNSIVAKRIKRSEGIFFKLLYEIHKIITFIFTGKIINFGNYSCLTKKDVKKIFSKASLWSSYSGTLKKFVPNLNTINSTRGLRYFGPSQMSFLKLIIHSFSIVAVFKINVAIRSFLFLLILQYSSKYLGLFSIFIQILILIFNLIIFTVSFRESENQLFKSKENLKNIDVITHQKVEN
tara:strand:+ start:210 stop:1097 length:888 start_codon:yes stop_codon:yes gene_type:complete